VPSVGRTGAAGTGQTSPYDMTAPSEVRSNPAEASAGGDERSEETP
jgi:hypothetical protein